jgi:D-arabinose 1-dehydrogenase-like Zn-dependent alcohol dehydrogenase
MRAAVLGAIGRPLSIEEVAIPEIGDDEVLIRVATCGVCRTDLHLQDGLAYIPSLPHIPGHEPAGVVEKIGAAVDTVTPGERVVPHLFIHRHECRFTRAGEHAQATDLSGIIGVTVAGGFAEYVKAPARNLLVLPDEVPFDIGGLTSCAVITAVHARRKAGLAPGDTAVVLGTGGIGLLLVQLLSRTGVRVVAVDHSPAPLAAAIEAGGSLALSIDDDNAPARLREHCADEKEGADCVFDLVGTARSMKFAASVVDRGGKIVVIGEEPEFPAIDTITIAQRELQIIGSRNGGLRDARDAIELLARGVIRPRIAARFPLDQINSAFDMVRGGRTPGRVIINING